MSEILFYCYLIKREMIVVYKNGLETRRCEFKSRSRQRIFRCRLNEVDQINMNLVFHISEDGILKQNFKHCASSKTSVKSLRKYFVHLNWIRLATNPSWLDSSIGKAAV